MRKLIIQVTDEANTFSVYEQTSRYQGIHKTFSRGEVATETRYSYPKTNIPEQLLIILCEVDNPYDIDYSHEALAWSLLELEDYEE